MSEVNKKLLREYLKDKRNCTDESVLDEMCEYLAYRGVFSVPFDKYLGSVFGSEVAREFRDYYKDGRCIFSGRLVIPLETLDERFIGFVMHDTLTQGKYKYPMQGLFKKDTYFQCVKDSFELAFEKGYVVIVEGVFDEISLSSIEVPAIAISGTSMSKLTAQVINTIPTKVICSDEDTAGRSMYKNCETFLTGNIISLKLPVKDADEYLKTKQGRDNFKQMIKEQEETGWVYPLVKLPEV